MSDVVVALLCTFAAVMQFITAPLVSFELQKAAKRVAGVGFTLGAVKYFYAAHIGLDLPAAAITAIPLTLICLAAVMNGWSIIFEKYEGGERRVR